MRNVLKAVNGTLLYRAAVVVGLSVLALSNAMQSWKSNSIENSVKEIKLSVDTLQLKVDSVGQRIDSLETIHPWKYGTEAAKKNFRKKLSSVISKTAFLNFVVWEPVDTSVTQEFYVALREYAGPVVRLNSLKRPGKKSKHCHGNAADLELTHELVEYLLTEEGQDWLFNHQLQFYIEGKPGSRKVRKYYSDPKYSNFVFFNSHATGDHIHVFRNV